MSVSESEPSAPEGPICAFCHEPLPLDRQRCGTCLRFLVHLPWLARISTWTPEEAEAKGGRINLLGAVTLLGGLPLVLGGVVLGVALPKEGPFNRAHGFSTMGLSLALVGGVLALDAFWGVRSGIDRTKGHLSRGLEARILGAVKLVLGLACAGLGIWLAGHLALYGLPRSR